MSYKKEIIDYEDNKDEIEKWLALKGETKYMKFADLLKAHNIPLYWVSLRDTYRYDKRLLVNVFKYLSFFEEFLRAQIWNNTSISYKKLEGIGFNDAMSKVANNTDIQYDGFDVKTLMQNKDDIYYVRNRVCHNKIMLTSNSGGKDIKQLLSLLANTLPASHRSGFVDSINNCSHELQIDETFIVNI